MEGLRGAVRLQLQIVRADRGYLNEILANPFFAVIFLGIVRAAGRKDLTAFALVAPVLITLWGMALEISGDIVDSDRGVGILESVVATPVGFPRSSWDGCSRSPPSAWSAWSKRGSWPGSASGSTSPSSTPAPW